MAGGGMVYGKASITVQLVVSAWAGPGPRASRPAEATSRILAIRVVLSMSVSNVSSGFASPEGGDLSQSYPGKLPESLAKSWDFLGLAACSATGRSLPRVCSLGSGPTVSLEAIPEDEVAEAFAEDALRPAVLEVALPNDDEIAVRVRRHRGVLLPARDVGVDLELVPLGSSGGVEALAEDSVVAPVLALAVPNDDEVPNGVRSRGWEPLDARGVGVDLELASLGEAVGVEALAEDPPGAPVLAVALPNDDEVPVRVGGHRGVALVARGVGVDLEVAPLGEA